MKFFNQYVIQIALICVGCLSLFACSTQYSGPKPGDPYYAPQMPPQEAQTGPANGAIYNPYTASFLFEDRKAHRVGDLITIVLTEETNASKTADTELSKESDLQMTSPTLFGAGVTINDGRYTLDSSFDTQREFTGEAESEQRNQLQGTITVTVHQVLPNGNLIVRGEKWIKLNQGDEYIRISGIVRPDDLQPNNTIASTRLADARIEYSGTGALAESNTPGWLTRFFNSRWFPF